MRETHCDMFAVLYAASIDCNSVALFGQTLGIHAVNVTLLRTDCCAFSGIGCSSNRVVDINWNTRGLNGTLNTNLLTSELTRLKLNGNAITGSIGNISLYAPKLKYLEIQNNKIEGNIPQLPISLQSLLVYYNKINGTLPVTLPFTLKWIDIGFLDITGILPILPDSINLLQLHHTLLSGQLPPILPSSLSWIGADNTFLGGPVPIFPNYVEGVFLGYLGSFTTSFNGTLRINNFKYLNIKNNFITDVIIMNITGIVECKLNNNTLLNAQYVSNLTSYCSIDNWESQLPTTDNLNTIQKTTFTAPYSSYIAPSTSDDSLLTISTFDVHYNTSTEIEWIVNESTISTLFSSISLDKTTIPLTSKPYYTASRAIKTRYIPSTQQTEPIYSTDSILDIMEYSTTILPMVTTQSLIENKDAALVKDTTTLIVVAIFSSIILLIIITLLIKPPKSISKYTRRRLMSTTTTTTTTFRRF